MTSIEEIAGGTYTAPLGNGAWTQSNNELIIGVIMSDAGDITSITDEHDQTVSVTYTGCFQNHFYRFPNPIKAATFSVGVTALFKAV